MSGGVVDELFNRHVIQALVAYTLEEGEGNHPFSRVECRVATRARVPHPEQVSRDMLGSLCRDWSIYVQIEQREQISHLGLLTSRLCPHAEA